MLDSIQTVIAQVIQAFAHEAGLTKYRYPEHGWFYEDEGRDIADALLGLDPSDLEFEDLYFRNNIYLPHWCDDSSLKWLLPGLVRIAFEHPQGEEVLEALFKELDSRTVELSVAQQRSLVNTHNTFYGTETYDWNPRRYELPLVTRMRASLEARSASEIGHQEPQD